MKLATLKNRAHQFLENRAMQALSATVAAAAGTIAMAHAGTGGNNAFGSLEQEIIGWAQGTLGVILAVVAILVGAGFAIARQSLVFVVVGIGFAIVLYFAPTVITGILTAAGGYGVVHPLIGAASSALLG